MRRRRNLNLGPSSFQSIDSASLPLVLQPSLEEVQANLVASVSKRVNVEDLLALDPGDGETPVHIVHIHRCENVVKRGEVAGGSPTVSFRRSEGSGGHAVTVGRRGEGAGHYLPFDIVVTVSARRVPKACVKK